MWIVLGNKVKTARVPGGRKVERRCASCGETAMFYEREVTSTFRLYFIDVFNYETQRVMACGACGEQYATEELGAPDAAAALERDRQAGTVLGSVKSALRRAGNALQDATGARRDPDLPIDEDGGSGRSTVPTEPRRLGDGTGAPSASDAARRARDAEAEADIDPLADDDPLAAKFAELERRLGKKFPRS